MKGESNQISISKFKNVDLKLKASNATKLSAYLAAWKIYDDCFAESR